MSEEEKYSTEEIKQLLFRYLRDLNVEVEGLYDMSDVLGENSFDFLYRNPTVERYLNELSRRRVPLEQIEQLVEEALSSGLEDQHIHERVTLYVRMYVTLLIFKHYDIESRFNIDQDLNSLRNVILSMEHITSLPSNVNPELQLNRILEHGDVGGFLLYLNLDSSNVDPVILLMLDLLLLQHRIIELSPPAILDQFNENNIRTSLNFSLWYLFSELSYIFYMNQPQLVQLVHDYFNRVPPNLRVTRIRQNKKSAPTEVEAIGCIEGNGDCPICMDPLTPFDENKISPDEYKVFEEYVCQLPCGHCFHESCIKTWLKREPRCPLCKFPYTLDDLECVVPKRVVWMTSGLD
jgi:hypothetical protein